ncbi:MAG: hypothetical protein RIC14_14130 [Filomicrobium sp.]
MSVADREATVDTAAPATQFNAMWFLKRFALGTAILAFSFGGLAWLTHAAIDPTVANNESLIEAIGRLASQF